MVSNDGRKFEASIESSCKEQNIFYHRIKDIFIPPELRQRVRVPKNKYDSFCFYKNTLFPLEFKSVNAKSINIKDPKIIKPHQTEALKEANTYEGTIPGFIFNFRKSENRTFFVHIEDYLEYQKCLLTGFCKEYENKINKSSLPISICEEIGTEISSMKKKVNYRYYMNKLFDDLIDKHKINYKLN